jgi:signal transduction histidine kinase
MSKKSISSKNGPSSNSLPKRLLGYLRKYSLIISGYVISMVTFFVVTVRGPFVPSSISIYLDSQIIDNIVFCTMLFSMFIISFFIKEHGRLRYLTHVEEQKLGLEGVKNQLKTRIMSTATHEIRTPLASIQGYTEIIQMDQENLSESQKRYFEVILRNVRRLSVLTEDLLDLQRLEEGKISINIETVDVRLLIEDVRSEFVPLLGAKKQIIEINTVDVKLSVDRLRIMQVLINLLSNASKFSPVGSVIILEVYEEDDHVVFSVTDQGIGIREDDFKKLFSPFPGIRVDGNYGGTGLGLSICKGIVDLHGGDIWAESDGPKTGCTFKFSTPFTQTYDMISRPQVMFDYDTVIHD